jgi:conjugal transfer pilus assembly protein TrbC
MSSFDGSLACWSALVGLLAAAAATGVAGLRLGSPSVSLLGALTAAGALAWSATPSLAAEDAAELVRQAQAQARATAAAPGLADWTAEVARRAALYETEARDLAADNAERLRQGFTYLEPAGAEAPGQPAIRAGAVYVAVSFSMEPQALRALASEANKAGAVLVIRGFVGGSVPRTLTAARSVFDENTAAGVAIDPQVFRAFAVRLVPTFIAAAAPVEPCGAGVDCTSPAPAHDRLSGNITLAEALRLLAGRGSAAPGIARSALARLEASR